MKNKIILIDVQEENGKYLEIPLGLLSIGTILKKNKYNIKIVKIFKNSPEKIKKYLNKDILCVGFGMRTDQVDSALTISKYIKNNFGEKIKIIWGGIHTNLYPKQVLENNNIDIIVLGDGEYTLVDIANALINKKSLKDIKGCGYKYKGKIILNAKREFTDLSKLPKTDYSIIEEIENYIEGSKTADAIMKGVAFFPIHSGVGCPFNCSFCYNSRQRERISKRSVKIMLDDIEYLQKKHNINFFRMRDELFFYDKKRSQEFLNEKKRRSLKFFWDSSFHINILKNENFYSNEFLKELKKEGFAYSGVGVESGSPNQIKRYRKNITPEDVLKVVKRTSKLKILLTYSFMIGAPYENYEDMLQTIRLIYKIKAISPEYTYITGPLSLFRPYPGADLYNEAIKLGYKEKKKLEDWKSLSKFTGYNTYNDMPYLSVNLIKIFNLFYYLKFLRGIFQIENSLLRKFLRKNETYLFITHTKVISFIGATFRIIVENKLIDKYIIRKILGRSLILEK